MGVKALIPASRRYLSVVYRSGAADTLRRVLRPALEWWIGIDRRRRHRHAQMDVLLIVHNPMMLEHALDAWCLINREPGVRGHLTMPRVHRNEAESAAKRHDLAIRRLGPLTRMRWWDLILAVNHVAAYARGVPVVRLQHGLDGLGKMINGQPWHYGRHRVLREDGSPIYARMFESSERVRRLVTTQLPQLCDTIVVVGNLTADRVLEHATERESRQRRLAGTGPVVAVLSTYGEHSLIETMGRTLFEEMKRLNAAGRYRFVLCPHPNLWSVQRRTDDPWDETFRELEAHGVPVSAPGDDWCELVALADVAISDHTSVCIPYSLLGRPLLTIPVPAGVLRPESTVGMLHRATPTFADPSALDQALADAVRDGLGQEARDVAARAVACVGEAQWRMREELLELLER